MQKHLLSPDYADADRDSRIFITGLFVFNLQGTHAIELNGGEILRLSARTKADNCHVHSALLACAHKNADQAAFDPAVTHIISLVI